MSQDVSNKRFRAKASISPAVYDIDGIIVYSYLPEEPGQYYRKIKWESNELSYVTSLDSYTVYTSGAWVDENYRDLVFGASQVLSDSDYAWLLTWADEVTEDTVYTTQASSLTAVANAIRAKGGTSATLTYPDGFVAAVNNIEGIVLPAGFQRVPYIESNGNQYIDSGIGSSNGYICRARFAYTDPSEAWSCICGSQDNYGGGDGRHGYIIMYGISGTLALWAGNMVEDTNITIVANNMYTIIMDLCGSPAFIHCNSVKYNHNFTGTLSSKNIFIFAINDTDEAARYKAKARLDYLELYNTAGVAVRQFYAAKRLSDNELGLYDFVTETFFTNQGTGSFITSI